MILQLQLIAGNSLIFLRIFWKSPGIHKSWQKCYLHNPILYSIGSLSHLSKIICSISILYFLLEETLKRNCLVMKSWSEEESECRVRFPVEFTELPLEMYGTMFFHQLSVNSRTNCVLLA